MIDLRILKIVCFGFIFFNFQISALFAEKCLDQKIVPSLEIQVPDYEVTISQPDIKMDLLHGDVVASLIEEYEFIFGIRKTKDGSCVYVEKAKLNIGYNNFSVHIDKQHEANSCEFEAIKEHEYEHINAHLSTINDNMPDIKQAVSDALNNIFPIFVANNSKIDSAMNEIETFFQSQPQISLMRKKIKAEQEIRNKKIDMNDRGERMQKCFNK